MVLKREFSDKWQNFYKKLAFPNEYFNRLDDYKKPVDILKKEDFISKLKNECPSTDEIQRTKEIFELFDIKDGEELSNLYLKSDVYLLADVFEKCIKISIQENGIFPLYYVSLPGYT